MARTIIKDKLQTIIDASNDNFLERIYAHVVREMEDEKQVLSDDDLKILEERRNNRLSGKSQTHTWPEVKNKILGEDRKRR